MEIWQSVKFTLNASWEVAKKLLLLYFFLQTVLALTFIIDLLSYKEVIDTISGSRTILGLSLYGVILVLFIYYLAHKVIEGITGFIWNLLDARLAVYLNGNFIDKLSDLDLSLFEYPQNVGLASRAFNRFQFQFKYYLKAIIDVYSAFIKLVISLSIFYFVSPLLAIVIILANLIQIFVNSRMSYGVFLIYRADDEIKRKFEYVVNTLFSKETLPEIKLYQAFGFLKEKLIGIYRKFTGHQLKIEKKRTVYNTLFGFLPTVSIFAYTVFIANQVSQGIISAGQFIFLFFNAQIFNGTLFSLGQNIGHLHADSLFMKDAIDFFALKPSMVFPNLSQNKKAQLSENLKNPSLKIENVSFKYPQSTGPVLKNISLEIPFGQKVALIGDNGAGKSTLVKLLLRIYDPQKGKISVNGIDIKTIPEDELFRIYSTLFQSFGKFYFTIRENLEMAANRKLTDDEMVKFLNFSNSWEYIRKTPGKLDQQLGSEFTKGIELSGGQWQRLAIARAYAKRSPVLILDEPTSAVDTKSEMEIFDRLNREMKNNTLIFVSHRFSTIKDAARIVVMDKGMIIEDGSHESLMKMDGKYARLYKIQAERYLRK